MSKLRKFLLQGEVIPARNLSSAMPAKTRHAILFTPLASENLGSEFDDVVEAVQGNFEVIVYTDNPVTRRAIEAVIAGIQGSEFVQFVSSNDEAVQRAELRSVARVHVIGYGDEIESQMVENLIWSLTRRGIEVVKNGVTSIGEFMNLLGQTITNLATEWKSALVRAKAA